jgi:uncharacterized DUF497 family protein
MKTASENGGRFLFAPELQVSSTFVLLTFEWDANKARTNLAKHQVGFPEATTAFGDAGSLTIPDPAHSQAEPRFIILGRSHQGRILVVVHTERGDNIRIISARPASRRERKNYEQANR